jgi:septal ring factor EnvC (AmiA/AmiB activator)
VAGRNIQKTPEYGHLTSLHLIFFGILEGKRILELIISLFQGIFMKQQIEQRLIELKAEYATGQKSLAELENKKATLENTLLRINTAIKALEEELRKEK